MVATDAAILNLTNFTGRITMNIIATTPNTLEQATLRQINTIASRGFGRDEDSMFDDTADHVVQAEQAQLCYDEHQELVAFALYKGCLWR
jgi:hypothetical protein